MTDAIATQVQLVEARLQQHIAGGVILGRTAERTERWVAFYDVGRGPGSERCGVLAFGATYAEALTALEGEVAAWAAERRGGGEN